MHPSAILTLALATLTSALSNQQICQNKCNQYRSGVCVAINQLCAHTDLTANSQYAMHGEFSGRNSQGMATHAFVAAKGKCAVSTSNWIPQQYCFSQFYEVCAEGDRYGHGVGRYGTGACQEFNLANI